MCQHKEHSPARETGKVSQKIVDLIPDHPACKEALSLAHASFPASILYHSLRVYLYSTVLLAEGGGEDASPLPMMPVPLHVQFVACILHDQGTSSAYDQTPERFEVSGADAAVELLRRHGIEEEIIKEAWLAMSLHTSGGIAERMVGLVRAIRLAVRADFGSYPVPDLGVFAPALASKVGWDFIEKELPRLDIEKDLSDAVVRQTLHRPEKAPQSSWSADLLRAKKEEPDWEGVNKAF